MSDDDAVRGNRPMLLREGFHSQIVLLPSVGQDARSWKVQKLVFADKNGLNPHRRPHNILQEVDILREAEHDNIINLIEYTFDPPENLHSLTLPLLALSMSQFLEQDVHPRSRLTIAKPIAKQLCEGVRYLHSLRIAHRDINPHNVMFDWQGVIKLIDFGVSCRVGEHDGVSQVGTGSWRAPELLFSAADYDLKTIDMWSLGVVIAEIHLIPVRSSTQDDDPLEQTKVYERPRTTLFDSTFGDLGLAASIFRLRGSPTSSNWPEFTGLPDAGKIEFDTFQPQPLSERLSLVKHLSDVNQDHLLDFLDRLLALSPARRLKADGVCSHSYITSACSDGVAQLGDGSRSPVLSVLERHLQAAAERYTKLADMA